MTKDTGSFEGTITIQAEPVSADMRKALSPAMLKEVDECGGSIVSVSIHGALDAHGLGRAMGSLVQAFLRQSAVQGGFPLADVTTHALPIICGSMMHYAAAGEAISQSVLQ